MSQNLSDEELIKTFQELLFERDAITTFNTMAEELLTRFKALSQQSKIDVDEVEDAILDNLPKDNVSGIYGYSEIQSAINKSLENFFKK